MKKTLELSYKTPGGHHRYDYQGVLKFVGKKQRSLKRIRLGYARFSSSDQRQNLVQQAHRLKTHLNTDISLSQKVIYNLKNSLKYKKKYFKK